MSKLLQWNCSLPDITKDVLWTESRDFAQKENNICQRWSVAKT